jgi:hypothetical protein
MAYPTSDEIQAAARHFVTFLSSASAMAGVLHFLNDAQVVQLNTSGAAFINALAAAGIAFGTILPIIMGWWSAITASTKSRVASVASLPDTTIVTTKAIADAGPDNVVSNEDAKVVPK